MTEKERQQLDQILDAHDRAHGAFQRSRLAIEQAMGGLRITLDGVAAANRAQDEAIDGIRAATHAALVWLRSLE